MARETKGCCWGCMPCMPCKKSGMPRGIKRGMLRVAGEGGLVDGGMVRCWPQHPATGCGGFINKGWGGL